MKKSSRFVLLAAACLVAWGCGQNAGNSGPPRTRLEYFTSTQAVTETPHGKILLESVQETAVGVRYTTTDGSLHEVDMVPQPDGTFRLTNYRHME